MVFRRLLNTPVLTMIIGLTLVGCSSQSLTTELFKTQPLEETLSPARNNRVTPSVAPLFTPTSTQLSVSPTPTQPITSTMPNQTPTLTDSERELFIMEMLKTNSGCELPCWWGIVPGETTWNETMLFLNDVGLRTSPYPLSNNILVYEAGGFDFEKMKIYNRVSFYEKSGLIDVVKIRSEGHIPEEFEQIWERYAPKQVFERYGQPSRVWIDSDYSYGKSEGRSYGLWLFYDEIGILIIYSGVVKLDPIYHICPWSDNPVDYQMIEIYLQSPENPQPLERFTNYSDKLDYIKPIEAGGLTVNDLYSIFIEEEQPCFDFPGTLFP